jgi:two-component system OmpR family sensor kinase
MAFPERSSSSQSCPPDLVDRLEQARRDREAAEQRWQAERESWQTERDELHAAVRARDELIAIAAHELRNPMTAVLLHVQGLRLSSERHGAIPELPRRMAMLEQRIKSFITRATTFLDITRLSAGAYHLEGESVALDEAVQVALDDIKSQAEHAGCTLQVDLQPGIVGQWDRLAVIQIAMNLLSNAVKYGGGKPVQVSVWSDGRDAFLRVADQGMGMSLADRQRVFAKFERAVRRQQHGGFGLGLWIVRQLIEKMSGHIEFTSVPGAGSTFTARLPIAAPGSHAINREEPELDETEPDDEVHH